MPPDTHKKPSDDARRTSTSASKSLSTSSSSASDSSTSSPSSPPSTSPADSTKPASEDASEDATSSQTLSKKKPLSRRGHFKSRLGCFNCKRRRVKCNEVRPCCTPCRRLGLDCAYPSNFVSGPATTPVAVQANPFLPTLNHLRFYHQFMTGAIPPIPIKADAIWTTCAAMSHEYEFLAHAVLGLGASHLSRHTSLDYSEQALSHRLTAIKLVNDKMATPPPDTATADALFAAVICLASQTALLPDAMSEYLAMSRGGNLYAVFIMPTVKDSIFVSFNDVTHRDAISEVICEQTVDFTVADEFMDSLSKLRPLFHQTYEIMYYDAIVKCIDSLRVSPKQAWYDYADLYTLHAVFPHEDFQTFINTENYPCQLLIIHNFLLDYILGPFCVSETDTVKSPARMGVTVSWARTLLKRLPPDFQTYGVWIKSFCDQLDLRKHDARRLTTP